MLDYSKKELRIAKWLERKFGGEIYMLPRINKPEGISTPDYLFRGERWDLKEIFGNGNQTLYHSIFKKSRQSNNFILDVTNSKLSLNEIMEQLNRLTNRDDTKYLNRIILKKRYKFYVFVIKK